MSRLPLNVAVAAMVATALSGFAVAETASVNLAQSPNGQLIQISGGCGPDAWRGRWGHCNWDHHAGWGPNGYYQSGPYRVRAGPYWNRACAPGSWRGPWGNCRNTPYHGPLPDGGYKP